MSQFIGRTMQVVGLRAAPDYDNIRRVHSWMRRYEQDMNGQAGTVYGDDRGSAVHSFNGPVTVVPNPTKAINMTVPLSNRGVYMPPLEFQDSVSANPGLDPYARLLWQRMGR